VDEVMALVCASGRVDDWRADVQVDSIPMADAISVIRSRLRLARPRSTLARYEGLIPAARAASRRSTSRLVRVLRQASPKTTRSYGLGWTGTAPSQQTGLA
jgi:hypothetical protein